MPFIFFGVQLLKTIFERSGTFFLRIFCLESFETHVLYLLIFILYQFFIQLFFTTVYLNKRRVLALGESNDSFGVVTRRQAREIIKKK